MQATNEATSAPLIHADLDGCMELAMSLPQAMQCSHSGPCDADIAELRQDDAIKAQLDALDPEQVRAYLHGFGAWDDAELADHDANLSRLLWDACCNIAEQEADREAGRN